MTQAIYFDGSGDYLIANANSGSFGTADFTIETLVKTPLSETSYQCIMSNYNSYNANSFSIYRSHPSAINKYAVACGLGFPNLTGPIPNNKIFEHVAVTRKGNTVTLFVNGINESAMTFTGNLTHSSGNTWIGTDGSGSPLTNTFKGWMNGFRIIKNESLYNIETTIPSAQLPNTAGTDTYYSNTYILLHGNGTNGSNNILNNGNGNVSITVFGNTSLNTAQVKFGNASIYFDGSSDYITLQEQSPIQGNNLITNGDFSNGSNSWTLSGAATVSGNVLSVSGGSNFAYQTNVLQTNKVYYVSFNMTTTSGNKIRINTGSIGALADGQISWSVTNGVVSGKFVSAGTLFSIEAAYELFSGTIDNVSVKLVETDIGNFNDSTKDVTFEAWVYPVVLSSWQYDATIPILFGYMNPTGINNNWSFGPMSDGTVRFYYYNGSQVTISSSEKILANQWSHVSFTKTSKGITIWVNGKGYGPTPISGTITTVLDNLVIGKYYTAGGINGYVDDLRYTYGNARYVYSGFTPPTVLSLTPNTTLLTCNALSLNTTTNLCIDQSNLGYSITTIGDVGLANSGVFLNYSNTTNSNFIFFNTAPEYVFANTLLPQVKNPNEEHLIEHNGDGKIYGKIKKRIGPLNVNLSNTKLILYSQNEKRALFETKSNTTGDYLFDYLNREKSYYIVAFDSEKQKNAVIADNIIPIKR